MQKMSKRGLAVALFAGVTAVLANAAFAQAWKPKLGDGT